MADCYFCKGSRVCPDDFHDEEFEPVAFLEGMIESIISECESCGQVKLPRPACPECHGTGEE